MKRIPLEAGRVALSMAGRDAGRRFVVLRVEETYAYVADGDLRKAEIPKKKKHRHLRALPEYHADIAEALRSGEKPTNAQLRKCLSAITQEP